MQVFFDAALVEKRCGWKVLVGLVVEMGEWRGQKSELSGKNHKVRWVGEPKIKTNQCG